jgi:thiol-disulfide isomerase/thioredoxin
MARFAAILAAVAFLLTAWAVSRRIDRRLMDWATWVIVAFVAGARAGHVLANVASFGTEPLRVFALWQGGFSWPAGLIAVVLVTILYWRNIRLIAWSALPLAVGGAIVVTALHFNRPISASLPQAMFETLDGRLLAPASLKGKPIILNMWATWCPPCQRELPMMAEVARANPAATFVFVDQGEDKAAIASFLTKRGIALDTVLLDTHADFARHYQILGLPTTLFLDSDGFVRSDNVGEISRETLIAGIEQLK